MKSLLLISTLLAFTLSSSTTWGQHDGAAASDSCAMHNQAMDWAGKQGQALSFRGLTLSGYLMEITLDTGTGRWTVHMTSAGGITCMAVSGDAGEQFKLPIPGSDA